MRLANKVALITGAGSGIGRESALLFAREGARVVVADVNDEDGQAVVEEIRGGGGRQRLSRASGGGGASGGRLRGCLRPRRRLEGRRRRRDGPRRRGELRPA